MQLRQFAAGLTAALILVAPVGANAWATEPTPTPIVATSATQADTESTEVVTEPRTIDPAPADTAKAEEPVVKPPDVKSTSDVPTSATPEDTESTEVTPKRDTPKSEDPKQGTEDQTAGTQPAPAPGLVRQAPVQASAPVQSAPLKVAADPVVTVTATLVASITASQNGTAVSYSADYVALKETGEPVAFSLLASTDGGSEVLLDTAGVRMVNGQPASGSVQGSMTVPEGAKSVTFTVVREFASGQAAPYTLNLVWPEPDDDKDGVPNVTDKCPATPAGETVDSNGCSASQRDTDGDGVKDNVDKCPATAAGEEVDSDGCSASQRDTDNDGVKDNVDQCPATAAGEEVDSDGCSASQRDTDGDGVKDNVDKCVNEPGPASNNGCPVVEPDPEPTGNPGNAVWKHDVYCNLKSGRVQQGGSDTDAKNANLKKVGTIQDIGGKWDPKKAQEKWGDECKALVTTDPKPKPSEDPKPKPDSAVKPAPKPAVKPAHVVSKPMASSKSDRRLPSGTGPSDYVAPSTLLAPMLLSPVTPVAAGLVLVGAVAAGLVSRRRQ